MDYAKHFLSHNTLPTLVTWLAENNVGLKLVNSWVQADSEYGKIIVYLIKEEFKSTSLVDSLVSVPGDADTLADDVVRHLANKVVPWDKQQNQLRYKLKEIYKGNVKTWFDAQPEEDVAKLFTLLYKRPPAELSNAINWLLFNIIADGLRLYKVDSAVKHTIDFEQLKHYTGDDQWEVMGNELKRELTQIETKLSALYEEQEQAGVSVKLTYKTRRLRNYIRRLRDLITMRENMNTLGTRLMGILVSQLREDPIADKVLDNTRLLIRQVVDYSSVKGRSYITEKLTDYRGLFLAAMGGGAFTAVTCVIKVFIGLLKLPPMLGTIAYSANYTISFLILYFLHLTLATKQPAMTASSLITTLKPNTTVDLNQAGETLIKICRSQFIAVMGNVGMVIPVSFVLAVIFERMFSVGMITTSAAETIIAKHNVLTSGTVIYAVITGVLLYLANFIGGCAHNFVKRNELYVERQETTLRGMVNSYVLKHAGGLVTILALGALLGFAPIIGYLTGVPFDVRHVTLAAGTITLALATPGVEVDITTVIMLIMSVGVIGLINVIVSFGLALIVSLYAWKIKLKTFTRLMRRAFKQILFHPLEFIFPKGKDKVITIE